MFEFKQFRVDDSACAMKVGTDSVLLGAWTHVDDPRLIIDAGAGSGLLSLMMAQRCQNAMIVALEIDDGACRAAKANFESSPWCLRIACECTDVLDYEPQEPVDLIICNPPYFDSGLVSPDSGRHVARHADGNFGPKSALSLASKWLGERGSLSMITPYEYYDELMFHASMLRLDVSRVCEVSTIEGKPPSRILWQIDKTHCRPFERTSMAVRSAKNREYTQEYKTLTKDFYLHL